MKKLIGVVLLLIALGSFTMANNDTNALPRPTAVTTSEVANATTTQTKPSATSVDSPKTNIETISKCFNCSKPFDGWQKLIVFLPIVIYLLFLIALKSILNKNGFKLSDTLTENTPVQITKANPDPAAAVANPTITTMELPKSASRLILFMSGFMAITISVCLTSYYIYVVFRTGFAPDLDALTNVLLSFGIGVVPYAFNKVSTALK